MPGTDPTVNNTGKIIAFVELTFSDVASKALNKHSAWYSVSNKCQLLGLLTLEGDRIEHWHWKDWECVRMKSTHLRPLLGSVGSSPAINSLYDLHLISLDLNYFFCKVILSSLPLYIWLNMRQRKYEGFKTLKKLHLF